jgi:HD superfamily phosphohydrolase
MIDSMFNWLPDNPRLYPFYEGIAKYVEDHVDLDVTKDYQNSKIILDPCVGYVEMYGWEIAILDTSLFQRLRKISQLGLAYLVYPTLRYSRFEHTIGVVGRLNQILQRLKEKHYDDSNINITDILKSHEKAVRLAAIFHDIGHCLFSHLSESVINELPGSSEYPSVDEIKRAFNEKFKLSKHDSLSIAEIFSITILGVKKISELLKKVKISLSQQINSIEEMALFMEEVARFIAGLPVKDNPKTVFLAQLISSGLDADKLDYMSREEHFSGIKIEMDLLRIFNKMKLFSISELKKLPKSLLKYGNHIDSNNSDNVTFIVFGIEKGGQFSYEEYCIARLALYEKIYLHKKVRAAEQYMKSKLQILVNETEKFKLAHNWLYLKESVVEKKFAVKTNEIRAINDLFTTPVEKKEFILDLTDIENRNIPFRAFTFGPANAKTDYNFVQILEEAEMGGVDAIEKLASVKFWNKFNDDDFKTHFLTEIGSEIKTIIKSLGILDPSNPNAVLIPKDIASKIPKDLIKIIPDDRFGNKHNTSSLHKANVRIDSLFDNTPENLFPDDELSPAVKDLETDSICYLENIDTNKIIIDVPNYKRVQLKYDSLYFEEANYQTIRWTIPINQIARYYQLNRVLAYIYSDSSYCPLVLLACEMIVYREHEQYFDQSSQISKEINDVVKEFRTLLISNKYYDGFNEIIPFSKDLESVTAREKINDLLSSHSKLKLFRKKIIRFLDVQNFLRQFPEELQLSALNLVNCIRVLPDEELDSEIEDVLLAIKNNNESSKIGIIPLGETFSSAIHMLKSFKTLIEKHKINTLNQTDSQIIEQDHLIFFDDNINSGRQSLNIFATWMGIDDEIIKKAGRYTDVKTKRDAKIIDNDKIIEKLKNTKLTFVFITGNEYSAKTLKDDLVNICNIDEKLIEVKIKHVLNNDGGVFYDIGNPKNGLIVSAFEDVKKEFNYEIDKNKLKLKEFLNEVGKQLVLNRSICINQKERPEDHALGYNNRQSLVIFPNSVPTMTITALWSDGTYKGKKWIPLIPRNFNN